MDGYIVWNKWYDLVGIVFDAKVNGLKHRESETPKRKFQSILKLAKRLVKTTFVSW